MIFLVTFSRYMYKFLDSKCPIEFILLKIKIELKLKNELMVSINSKSYQNRWNSN